MFPKQFCCKGFWPWFGVYTATTKIQGSPDRNGNPKHVFLLAVAPDVGTWVRRHEHTRHELGTSSVHGRSCRHGPILWTRGRNVCMYPRMYVCIYVCMSCYVCMYVFMCACMHACMHACIYVCMYVCMCIHTYVHICTYMSIQYISIFPAPECGN